MYEPKAIFPGSLPAAGIAVPKFQNIQKIESERMLLNVTF